MLVPLFPFPYFDPSPLPESLPPSLLSFREED